MVANIVAMLAECHHRTSALSSGGDDDDFQGMEVPTLEDEPAEAVYNETQGDEPQKTQNQKKKQRRKKVEMHCMHVSIDQFTFDFIARRWHFGSTLPVVQTPWTMRAGCCIEDPSSTALCGDAAPQPHL